MLSKYKFTSLIALILASCLLASCSSSTSSSGGSGQIPTGLYNGSFSGRINGAPYQVTITARLSISFDETPAPAPDDETNAAAFAAAGSITGNLAVTGGDRVNGQRCFTGGPVTGTVTGDQMTLDIKTLEDAIISMTGRVTDNTYSGTFSANESKCHGLAGSFSFKRI